MPVPVHKVSMMVIVNEKSSNVFSLAADHTLSSSTMSQLFLGFISVKSIPACGAVHNVPTMDFFLIYIFYYSSSF